MYIIFIHELLFCIIILISIKKCRGTANMNFLCNLDYDERHTINSILNECIKKKVRVYLVGGAVRDIILGKTPKDIDICLECNPMDIIKDLREVMEYKYYERFQTSNIIFNNDVSIDLIRCRKEVYNYNGALPEVIPSGIYDDLHRRDFTINAIAYDIINQDFVDPFNGIEDIKSKIIKSIHSNSYFEDPTRIFRAVRYSNRYAFNLEDIWDAKNAIKMNVFKSISNDRIIREIVLMCKEEEWIKNILMCKKLGIFSIYENKLNNNNSLCNYLEINNRILNLFISLTSDEYREKFIDNSILDKELKTAFKNYTRLIEIIDRALSRNLSNYEIYCILNKLNVYGMRLLSFNKLAKYKVINYMQNLQNNNLSVKGNYLTELGIVEGKYIKYIFDILLNLRLNTGVLNDTKYLTSNLGEILNAAKHKN